MIKCKAGLRRTKWSTHTLRNYTKIGRNLALLFSFSSYFKLHTPTNLCEYNL